jgi:4-amino-4-deoxy-L-arabinose transferase-like glycosyltransferase
MITNDSSRSQSERGRRGLHVVLVIALAVGIALRVIMIREIPPGLYRDEAFTGMDGVRTLQEGPRLFYPVSFGREPLFTWLVAGSVGIWGATPFATRFPSLVVGIATLIALYLAAREIWGERVAVLSTAVLAITLWHVLFSRVSFRAVLIPLFASLSVWQAARAVKSRRWVPWAVSGAMAGTLLYTYIAARAAVIPALLMIAYAWARRGRPDRPTWWEGLSFGLAALIVMAPFLLYTLAHPDEVLQRTNNVASVFNSETPWAMLGANVKGALGMFLFRGDYLPRHNVPLRPVFDPALGLMFVIGVVVVFRRFKRDYASAFLVFWIGGMLLPMILAEKAPHFIRGLGILPFLAVVPALGLDATWRWLAPRSRWAAYGVIAGALVVGFGSTVWAYFVQYPQVPDLCYRFECAGTQLASEVNEYLGTGWVASTWFARKGPARDDRQVFLEYQLWKDVVNAHYLIPDSAGFNVPDAPSIDSQPPNPDLPMIYYGWYNGLYPDRWRQHMREWLPPRSRIELTEGPMTITHQDNEPHPAYLKLDAEPLGLPAERLVDFEHELSLVDSCLASTPSGLAVRLIWFAGEVPPVNYTAFLHVEREGAIIAQDDREPGLGHYPMTAWRPGDQLVDERVLAVDGVKPGDRIYTGLYFYATGERVSVLDTDLPVEDDRVELEITNCR